MGALELRPHDPYFTAPSSFQSIRFTLILLHNVTLMLRTCNFTITSTSLQQYITSLVCKLIQQG